MPVLKSPTCLVWVPCCSAKCSSKPQNVWLLCLQETSLISSKDVKTALNPTNAPCHEEAPPLCSNGLYALYVSNHNTTIVQFRNSVTVPCNSSALWSCTLLGLPIALIVYNSYTLIIIKCRRRERFLFVCGGGVRCVIIWLERCRKATVI
jgi:hypothetical protein